MSGEQGVIAVFVFSTIAAFVIVGLLKAVAGTPVIICPHCRYHNRPRNSRCWWCGERLR